MQYPLGTLNITNSKSDIAISTFENDDTIKIVITNTGLKDEKLLVKTDTMEFITYAFANETQELSIPKENFTISNGDYMLKEYTLQNSINTPIVGFFTLSSTTGKTALVLLIALIIILIIYKIVTGTGGILSKTVKVKDLGIKQ